MRKVERLIEATKGSRNEVRDRCLLLLMFRHGLCVSEACGMKLDQVDTESRVLHVARLKRRLIDDATTHPLRGFSPPTKMGSARPVRYFSRALLRTSRSASDSMK